MTTTKSPDSGIDYQTIKAIQTRYNGHHFRSRLEARWAVFFDAAGIKWVYEPEAFEFDGVRYMPDFYLPDVRVTMAWSRGKNIGAYFEVKPTMPNNDYLAILERFSLSTLTNLALSTAGRVTPFFYENDNPVDRTEHQPACSQFIKCSTCGLVSITLDPECADANCEETKLRDQVYHVIGTLRNFSGSQVANALVEAERARSKIICTTFDAAIEKANSARFEGGSR